MTYEQSLRYIKIAEAVYFRDCDLAETDEVIANDLECFHTAKQYHREQFGSLSKHNGEWM